MNHAPAGPIRTPLHGICTPFRQEGDHAQAAASVRLAAGILTCPRSVRMTGEINPLICNNHTGFLTFRMVSTVCCGVWLELSSQKPIRGVVCILLNTNSMYTERYKEWEGFRRSWHCRKIQKFRFSHNAYLLVFGSD